MDSAACDRLKMSFPTFFISPKYRFLRHFIFIFCVIVLFSSSSGVKEYKGVSEWIIKFSFFSFCLAIIYFNMYVLVPKLLFRDKYWHYLAAVFSLMAVVFTIMLPIGDIVNSYRIDPVEHRGTNFFISFFAFIFILGIFIAASTAIKLLQQWIIDGQRLHDLEKVTMKAELEQLKNQINPHFLFNMLNNVNVLTQKDPAKASSVLMVLSDLLRYQLYDTSRSEVLLTADIQFLTDFLNLENVRRDNFVFTVSTEGDIKSVMVPPLLFIPFVENATKHSLDGEKETYVYIFFRLEEEILHFSCINSKPEKPNAKQGGLGLTNIKRRLKLLFPKTHTLAISENKISYTVNLSIKL